MCKRDLLSVLVYYSHEYLLFPIREARKEHHGDSAREKDRERDYGVPCLTYLRFSNIRWLLRAFVQADLSETVDLLSLFS